MQCERIVENGWGMPVRNKNGSNDWLRQSLAKHLSVFASKVV